MKNKWKEIKHCIYLDTSNNLKNIKWEINERKLSIKLDTELHERFIKRLSWQSRFTTWLQLEELTFWELALPQSEWRNQGLCFVYRRNGGAVKAAGVRSAYADSERPILRRVCLINKSG